LPAAALTWLFMIFATGHSLKLEMMRLLGAGRQAPVPPQSLPI
jgi:hypothetical protein